MEQLNNEAQTSSSGIPKEENRDIVLGHRSCKTCDAKWLCIENVYQKFHRPNYYDIGGTYYLEDLPDFWFTSKTEQVGDIFLLHIFIQRYCEGSFSISISHGSETEIDKKQKIVRLTKSLKEYKFENTRENSHSTQIEGEPELGCLEYVSTYNFSNLDVGFMKNKSLYIAIAFPSPKILNLNVFDKLLTVHTFEGLLKNLEDADFTLVSEDGEKFRVHKAILAAHSDVFKAMFREETIESQKQLVKLVDVTAEDLKYLIEYLYTGYLKNIENADFVNLLMIADRYNLKGLRHLSQCALAEQLTIENAFYILAMADMYDSNYLKAESLKFIKKNKDTLKVNTFKDITNAELVRELFTYLVDED